MLTTKVQGVLGVVFLLLGGLAAGCKSPPEPAPAASEPLTTTSVALSGDSGSDAGPASPSIGSFALYATEAIELNSETLVTGCNVGVENTTGPFLGGGAAAYFNSGATIQSSQTLYAYSTYLNSGVSLGPIDTDHVLGNGGATYGTLSTFPAMPAPPATPAATAGTTSVTLNSNATRTLAAGAYGSVTVNSGAKLTLTGGTYVFSSLTMNSGGTLAVSAATTLSVTGAGSFGSGSFTGPAAGSGLTAKALVMYFDSSSGISLNSNAQVQALFIATNARVTVNTSKFTGALAAAQVVMNSGATVTCQDGFGSLGGGGSCSGSCDDGNPCTTDACSGGTCTHTPVTNGTTCTGTNACEQTYTCQAGACTGSTPVVCTASDQCHVAGTCDPTSGACSNPTAANGTTCNDDNACTQSDACESGTCTGSNPVTCTAEDQCHTAGTCNPSTGVCSNPTAANGTSCSDGNACTVTDSCQSGTCTGSNPVTCVAGDQCHAAGTCDPSSGVCSNPALPNGTSCNDGNACTQVDSCQAGVCAGSSPVTCTASDQCHAAGTCNPSSGACSNPTATNGTTCNDGNACTQTDACQNGTCTGSNAVTCTASDQCHVAGTCNTSTGACSNPTASNGTTCNDGNACTQTDACQSGTCTGSNSVTCTASDQCHVAGTCNASTGACSNPTASNGTTCNDGNACTQTDSCQGGACTGSNPVTCTASDQCHVAGTCNTSTGACSNPTASNGTSCNDGNPCDINDACLGGVCVGTPGGCDAGADAGSSSGGSGSGSGGSSGSSGGGSGSGGDASASDASADGSESGTPAQPPQWPAASVLTAAPTGTSSVKLAWTAAADAIGVTGYEIFQNTSLVATVSGVTQSYFVNGLTTGQTYTFTIQAGNATGAWSTNGPTTAVVAQVPVLSVAGAPPIDQTVASSVASIASFLYSGASPVQLGLKTTISNQRVAVLQGRVLDNQGVPLPGAAVTVADHPEYGYSISRADGHYDLVVNGGGAITISFDMSDTLHAERSEQLSWATFVHVPDVALVPEDAQATPVDLSGAAGIQVARGSQVQDSWGTRTATLVFAPGTTALMTLPSGASEALAGVHIRATEFTVGPNGPAAMPAALPATSGYTYAAAFTIDEAEAAQATGVSFSKPVAVYMEDFLNIFVGVDMPSGYYDSSLHAWVPSRNGRIVQVLSVSGGIATLDVDGQGQPASAAELATLGITSDELGQIAAFYPAGQDLWRVPIQHFSPWDFNQNDGPPGGACGPNQSGCGPGGPGGGGGGGGDCDGTATGCIIDIEAQILGEQVAVGGTPFSLNYRSERTSGYRGPYVLSIPLTDAVPPSPLQGVQLEVDIAGEVFTQAFNAAPSQVYTFEWDGNDGYGRPVQGQQPVSVKLGYVYTAQYVAPSDNPLLLNPSSYDADFGHFTYFGVPASTTGRQITLWYYWTGMLGDVHASPQDGLGGWTLSAHDMYDPASQTIFYGDGHKRTVDTLPQITTTIAGNPNAPPGFSGDGGPASQATLNTFQNGGSAVTVGPDGTVYILDSGNGRVRAITPDGNINTVATGVSGGSITTGPDGTLYIADGGGVRHIDSHGAISTVAGGGCAYPVQLANAVPALGACLGGVITSIAFAPDGTMYLLSEGSAAGSLSAPEALFRVTVDGYIWLVLSASGATQPAPSGVPLSQAYLVGPAELTFPPSMAVGNDGVVYISDGPFIRRIGNDGVFSTVAGDGFAYTPVGTGDGALATSVAVTPAALAVDPSGTVVFIDYSEYSTSTDFYAGPRVRAVHPDGVITTIAGTGASTLPGQPWLSGSRLAAGTPIDFPSALALAPDGTLLILQSIDALCRVTPAIQGDDVTGFEIANEAGTAVDVFDGSGRHLATRDALTASLLYSFTYDPAGRLASVIDLDGNTTTLQRDASGLPTAIVGPYGQSTALAVGADGSLSSIQDAVGNTYSYLYDAGGLLQSTTTPRGGLFQYIYDGYGRLLQDVDPAGGGSTFNLAGSTDGNVVTRTTAAGVVSSYHINNLASADVQQTVTQPNGLQSTLLRSHTGTNTQTTADGTVTTWTLGADPRFGMQAPTMSQMTIKTPSGLASATTVAKAVTLSNPTDLLSVQTATVTQSVNGNVWATVFNAPLKTLTTTSPAGRQVVTTIDTHGRPTQVALANTAPLTFTYDGHGRLLTTSQGTRTWSQSYDALGNLMSTTDPLGHVTSYANDHIGRPLTTVLPDGRQIGQTYDADSNVLSLTLPSDNTHAFAYTPVDLMSTYSPPTLGTGAWSTTYAYNLDRQVVTEMRPNGTTIASTYDPAGRLQTVTTPDGVATYVYDSSTGRLASSVASSGETLRYSYDGFLRTGVSWGGPITGTLSRGFDANFRMTSQTVNGVQLPFAYDPDGLVVQAGVDQLSLDPQNGRLRGTSLGAVMDSYSYDSNGLFGSYEAQVGVNALYSESVLRDVSGRITQKTETVQGTSHTWNYTYDANDRLTDATDDSGASSHYAYDGDDNRTTFVRNGVTINPTYDAQDRLLAYGAASYQYTANGELTNKTDGSGTTSYSYSAFGELLSVSRPDGTLIQYVHDAEHRRIGKNVNGSLEKAWLYDGQFRIVAELDNTGNVVSRFVPGDRPNGAEYMVRGGNTYRLIRDHIGSMRLVVDTNSGAIVERVDYDEFGVVTGDTQPGFQPFGFAGGLYDADTGLVRFGLRDYDASVGRWTAKDPTRFRGGMNLYGYVVNDPVDGLDFSGTDLADCTLASIWAASICVAALEDPFLLPLCIQAQADAAAECNNGGGATPQPNPSPCAKMCIGNGSSGCRVKKGEFKGTKTCNYGCDNGHNCSDKYVSCDKSGWSEPCPTSTESCE